MSSTHTWYLTSITRDNQTDPTWDVNGTSTEVTVWFGTQAEYDSQSPTGYNLYIIDQPGEDSTGEGDADELRTALLAFDGSLNIANDAGYLGTYDVNLDADPEMEPTVAFAVDGKSVESSTSAYMITLDPVTLTSFPAEYKGGVAHFDPFDPGSLRPPCFVAGTMIETVDGPCRVEDLRPGDLVLTVDHGLQPLRLILSARLDRARLTADPDLRPIRIRPGALGAGTPSRDLLVSPQHRILLRSRIAQRMFDSNEVLVAAKHLTCIEGIDVVADIDEVSYYHMIMDRHELVQSDGAVIESFYPGPEGLKILPHAARAEFLNLFPEFDSDALWHPAAVRQLSNGRMGRRLAQRHAANGRELVA